MVTAHPHPHEIAEMADLFHAIVEPLAALAERAPAGSLLAVAMSMHLGQVERQAEALQRLADAVAAQQRREREAGE